MIVVGNWCANLPERFGSIAQIRITSSHGMDSELYKRIMILIKPYPNNLEIGGIHNLLQLDSNEMKICLTAIT